MSNSPWQTLSTRTVYENQWISVEEDQVITPGGNRGIYGRVHAKKTAVAVIPLDEELCTWLVGQHRYPLDAYSWEIPMGGGCHEDGVLKSAQRELLEETGIEASQWEQLMTLHTSNSISDEVGVVYVARDLIHKEASPDDTEDITLRRIPLVDAIRMVMQGDITDSISAAALLKIGMRLGIRID